MDSIFEEFQTEDVMSLNHAYSSYNIIKALGKYDQQYRILPELELELSSGKAKPDLSICQNINIDWLNDIIRLTEAPLSVIEILSPKQALTDLTDKIQSVYFPGGVRSAWIVIPTLQTIYLFIPNQAIQIFSGKSILSDNTNHIELNLSDVFQ